MAMAMRVKAAEWSLERQHYTRVRYEEIETRDGGKARFPAGEEDVYTNDWELTGKITVVGFIQPNDLPETVTLDDFTWPDERLRPKPKACGRLYVLAGDYPGFGETVLQIRGMILTDGPEETVCTRGW